MFLASDMVFFSNRYAVNDPKHEPSTRNELWSLLLVEPPSLYGDLIASGFPIEVVIVKFSHDYDKCDDIPIGKI